MTRFLPDPFQPGCRLYRTGDRGKRLASGDIAFLGRIDRQVKVRGFRVELGEVEAALACHPAVRQAVVCLGARGPLVAYVTTRAELEPGALNAFLRATLPGPMIPASITVMDVLPLTSNGKIDYAALPQPDAKPVPQAHTAPRDEVELALTLMWRELLGRDDIGVADDFFDAGGHSLLAVQLMAQIGQRFGQALPLASLFEHGTITALAELLRLGLTLNPTPLVTLQPGGAGLGVVFVHPAGGNVLCYYALAQALGTARPFRALQAHFGDGEPSIAAMARRYKAALPPEPPPVLGGWSMGALVAFEMARIYESEGAAPPMVAVLDQLAPGAATSLAGEDDLSRLIAFARKVSELVGQDIGLDRAALEGLEPAAQAKLVLDRFKRHDLAPAATTPEDFRAYLDLMLTHNRITADYRPQPYSGKVVVFRADASLTATVRAPDLGWGRWCTGGVSVVAVPGNHVSIMRAPNVHTLAARLLEHLP